MSGTTTSSDVTSTGRDSPIIPILVAVAVLVVAVVGAVYVFGVERPPSVEPLESESTFTPPGTIAWRTGVGTDRCLYVGEPRGATREVACNPAYASPLAFTDEGILVREEAPDDERFVLVDPATGERSLTTLEVEPEPRGMTPPWTDHEDGRLRVAIGERDAEQNVVWEVEAPDTYDIRAAVVSPDGTSVAMTDSEGRLLVAPTDGSVAPLLWSEQVGRYTDIIWEGTELQTAGG